MEVVLINGSPRGKKSSSLCILNGLKDYLMKGETSIKINELMWNRSESGVKDFEKLLQNDAIVLAFPLYIDSIPSHLLRNLVQLENYIKANSIKLSKKINVYVIVNNGFFEGKQNCLAIDNIEHFCNHVGFTFKQGIGIGGGGMMSSIENVPFGNGPKKTIGNELMAMAENIKCGEGVKSKFMEPNIPAIAYKVMAEFGWRKDAKKNGLKGKDLGRQLTYKTCE